MPVRGRAAQLAERHAFGGEVLEQRQPLGALRRPRARRAGPRRRSRSAPRSRDAAYGTRHRGQRHGGGRRPRPRAESQTDDRPRHRPRPGQHRLRRGRSAAAGACVALDGGVIETRAGLALERRLADIHAAVDALLAEHEPRGDGARGAVLRPERAHAPSRSGRRAAWRCWRPASAACRARATPRSRSRARSAATGAPTRSRSRGWCRRCSACRGAAPRPRRRRARGRDLPRQLRAAVERALRAGRAR